MPNYANKLWRSQMFKLILSFLVLTPLFIIFCAPGAASFAVSQETGFLPESEVQRILKLYRNDRTRFYADLSQGSAAGQRILRTMYTRDPDFQQISLTTASVQNETFQVYGQCRAVTDPPSVVELFTDAARERSVVSALQDSAHLKRGFGNRLGREVFLVLKQKRGVSNSLESKQLSEVFDDVGYVYADLIAALDPNNVTLGASVLEVENVSPPRLLLILARLYANGPIVDTGVFDLSAGMNFVNEQPSLPITTFPSYDEPAKWPKPLPLITQLLHQSTPNELDLKKPIKTSMSEGQLQIDYGLKSSREPIPRPVFSSYRYSFSTNQWSVLAEKGKWELIVRKPSADWSKPMP